MFAKIIAILTSAIMSLLAFFGLKTTPPPGMYDQVFYQGQLYADNMHPDYHIPATLEKDAPELTYVGRVTSITRKFAEPTKELQGNHWDMKRGEVYLHEDGYLYLFPVLGDAYTLTPFPPNA